jgi:hypothetical protein
MTPEGPLEFAGGGRLRALRLIEPSGRLRARGSRRMRGKLLLERGSGGLKSIQRQTEFSGEDGFHFLSQTGFGGERFLLLIESLIEIRQYEPQNLVLYSTSNHDYHRLFAGLFTVLTAIAALLKQHGFRHQE